MGHLKAHDYDYYCYVCVRAYMKAEFDKAGARIVVVSLGSRSAAVQWQKETSCQYSILLDPERQVNRPASHPA